MFAIKPRNFKVLRCDILLLHMQTLVDAVKACMEGQTLDRVSVRKKLIKLDRLSLESLFSLKVSSCPWPQTSD